MWRLGASLASLAIMAQAATSSRNQITPDSPTTVKGRAQFLQGDIDPATKEKVAEILRGILDNLSKRNSLLTRVVSTSDGNLQADAAQTDSFESAWLAQGDIDPA